VRGKYGRRGRSGDHEYGIKNLLTRNLEHLTAAQFTKVIDTLDADAAGQETAAAWIAKEKLRDALNLRARITGSAPSERNVRDRLFAFYDHLGAPVGSLIDDVARGLAASPKPTDAAKVMAGAILFAYTAMGLLNGYLMTTTWYQNWIVRHIGQS
jgi:hypothetical protein